MFRRQFVRVYASALLFPLIPTGLIAQFRPLAVRLVRRTGWEELMQRNKCVIGDFFVASPDFPMSDRGRKLCNALELPWRNNIKEISAIPEGQYKGSVRTDGKLGWRIELSGTGERKNVQIHLGNKPDNTRGCILLGTGDSTDASCSISGSKQALQLLQAEFGASLSRPVVLKIES